MAGDYQVRGQRPTIQRLLGYGPHDLGVIVVLAQMAEDQGRGAAIEFMAEVVVNGVIGKMAVAAHHALLDGPRVGAHAQDFEVMIGFEQQEIRTLQVELDGIRNVAEIGDHAELDALGAEAEADGVDGIVRDSEAVDFDVADREARAGLKTLEARCGVFPIDQRRGLMCHVDRGRSFFCEAHEAGDVIAMLVGDEDGVEAAGLFADGRKAPGEFLETEAGVDQDTGAVRGQQRTIAGTAAREHAEFDDRVLLGTLVAGKGGGKQEMEGCTFEHHIRICWYMVILRHRIFWPVLLACLGTGRSASRVTDASEIVARATEALKSDWAADPAWAFTEKDEVQKGDRLTSKSFQVVMIDGSDYRLPLAIDERPFPPARRKAELIKLKDEVQRRKNEGPSARRSRIAAWQKQRDENGELLLDFPTALTFQLLGEETKDGQAAYVFFGEPKPGMVPATRAAKVLTGMQGKAWVEKGTLHPIHVDCTVVRPVPVYGALASVLPGTDIEIGMTKVADSTWLIDMVSMKLKVAKIRVFKSTTVTRFTYTDYRPNGVAVEELLSEAGRE